MKVDLDELERLWSLAPEPKRSFFLGILAELRAARALAAEVRGMIGAFECELRDAICNTNVACLKAKLDAYDAATKGQP